MNTVGIMVLIGILLVLFLWRIISAIDDANNAFDNSDGSCNCTITKRCNSRHTTKCDTCKYNKGYSVKSYYKV